MIPKRHSLRMDPASPTLRAVKHNLSPGDQLVAWRSSKQSFGSQYGHVSTSTFSSEISMVSYINSTGPTATSLITLCDGHARVVGQWTTWQGSATTSAYRWQNTHDVFVPAAYPTPKPCSISPSDCQLLWSSWSDHWDAITSATPDFSEGLLSPPCETSEAPQPSYSTNAEGEQCENCLIAGSQIRLLYWPVTTVAGSGDLCGEEAETVTGTATGPLRSIVTEGITITSPTIGVSIGKMSRVDNCGTTVDHTIIPVLPEDVSSVEGARALFTHRSFNFADLNFKCLDAPNEEFVTTGTRTDCYQEVPASAYFTGHANAAGAQWDLPGAFANRTIWPNYYPQVLPPETLTAAIMSLWGPNCYIHPDGIWDPPIALQQEASFPLPQYVPGAPTQYYTPHTDAPRPGGPTTPHAPESTQPVNPTAEAQLDSSAPRPTQPRPTASGDQDEGHGGYSHGSDVGDGHHALQETNGVDDGPNQGQDGDSNGSDAENGHASGQETSDGGSGQNDGQGDGQNDGGHGSRPGHEVVYTTVVTYTSGVSGGVDEQTAGKGGQAYTTTFLSTAMEEHQDDSTTPTSERFSGDSDDSSPESSPTSVVTSVVSSGSVPSTDSSAEGDISSAIQSGIGGGDGSDSTPSQLNIGSLTTKIDFSLSILFVTISLIF